MTNSVSNTKSQLSAASWDVQTTDCIRVQHATYNYAGTAPCNQWL